MIYKSTIKICKECKKLNNFSRHCLHVSIYQCVKTMSSRTVTKYMAVADGLLDYYDENEHFYQDEAEIVEILEEDGAMVTLQKIPDELVFECLGYVSKETRRQFSGHQYVFRTMLKYGQCSQSLSDLIHSPLAARLRDLPLPILLKFVEKGTPSKCVLTICPVKYQKFVTDIHSDIMDYCDNGINKEALVQLIMDLLAWSWDYSSKKGFQAYIQKFGFWRCYHMNSSYLTKNQNKMAAWTSYSRASRPIFKGIFRKLVLSIMYVHSKFCQKRVTLVI